MASLGVFTCAANMFYSFFLTSPVANLLRRCGSGCELQGSDRLEPSPCSGTRRTLIFSGKSRSRRLKHSRKQKGLHFLKAPSRKTLDWRSSSITWCMMPLQSSLRKNLCSPYLGTTTLQGQDRLAAAESFRSSSALHPASISKWAHNMGKCGAQAQSSQMDFWPSLVVEQRELDCGWIRCPSVAEPAAMKYDEPPASFSWLWKRGNSAALSPRTF